jgi:hypothetical protein
MNDHTGFLIYYYNIIIFINDGNWNIFREKLGFPWRIWKNYLDNIIWFNPVIGFDSLIIDKYVSWRYSPASKKGICQFSEAIVLDQPRSGNARKDPVVQLIPLQP